MSSPSVAVQRPQERQAANGLGWLGTAIASLGAAAGALTLAYCVADPHYRPLGRDARLYFLALGQDFALGPGLLVAASSGVGLLLCVIGLRRSPRTIAVVGTAIGVAGLLLLALAYPKVQLQRRTEAVMRSVYLRDVTEPSDAELKELAPRLFPRLLRDVSPDHPRYWKEGTGHPSAWRTLGRLWALGALSRAERDQIVVWSTGLRVEINETIEVELFAPHHLPSCVSHAAGAVVVEIDGQIVSESKHAYDPRWLHGTRARRMTIAIAEPLEDLPDRFRLRVTLRTEVFGDGAIVASASHTGVVEVGRGHEGFEALSSTYTSDPDYWR